jgi:tol-pal system protein YbgF
MPGRRLRALTLCLPLVAAGCASSDPYWNSADKRLAEDTELRERVVRLESELAAAAQSRAALEARAAGLERELTALRAAGGASAASPTGERAPGTEAPEPAMPRERAEIEQSDLDEAQPAGDPAGSAAATTPDGSQGPRELYERSLQQLDLDREAEAEAGFRRFLAENPTSDLADNAQFWLAESALRRGDTAAALAGFRAVVENYPEGNKVPDALLKVGYCLASLGEPESAATVYAELLARFPQSAAAETARARLGAP